MGMVRPASCSMGEARTEHRAPCEVLKRHAITTLQNMVVIAREPLSALPAYWQWPLRVAERTREAHRASASALPRAAPTSPLRAYKTCDYHLKGTRTRARGNILIHVSVPDACIHLALS